MVTAFAIPTFSWDKKQLVNGTTLLLEFENTVQYHAVGLNFGTQHFVFFQHPSKKSTSYFKI